MEHLRRKVKAVRRRLMWLRFASITLISLFWLSVVAAVTLVVCRLVVPIGDEATWQVTTWYIVGGLLALALPTGLLGALLGRMSLFRAALEADEQLGLRERLSSAILLRGPRRPMEELLEADAVAKALRIRPHHDFPFRVPGVLRWLPVPILALALTALLLDQRNLLASEETELSEERREELMQLQEDNEERAEELESLASVLEEVTAEMEDPGEWEQLQRELERLAEDLREPDTSRLEQLAELSDLADQMAERRDELERQVAESRNFTADPSARMTSAIQQAMQEGDMEEAQEAIEELMQELAESLESGEFDAEDLEQLAEELAQMAEELGGDESMTGEQMQQAAQAMQMAAAAMAQSGDASGGQAQQGATGEAMQAAMAAMSQAMGDLADAQEQLSIAEALEADLNAARASVANNPGERAGECQACRTGNPGACEGGSCSGGRQWLLSMRSGQWRPGQTNNRGQGTGGPGQGMGGRPPESDGGNVTFRDEQLHAQHTPGVIIAEFRHDDGVQIPGDANAPVADVFLTYEQHAEETLETEVIPAGYRNITRGYFDTIHPVQTASSGDPETESTTQE